MSRLEECGKVGINFAAGFRVDHGTAATAFRKGVGQVTEAAVLRTGHEPAAPAVGVFDIASNEFKVRRIAHATADWIGKHRAAEEPGNEVGRAAGVTAQAAVLAGEERTTLFIEFALEIKNRPDIWIDARDLDAPAGHPAEVDVFVKIHGARI